MHSHRGAPNRSAGFTFLEMAVVLTIIALIIGGTLVAQNLLRASEVQSVINDEDRYKKAIQLFKEKYNYLPGDMPTATTFWGTDPNGCPDNTPAGPQTATCNGDGNGRIDTFAESMRAWQQLANAGFIDGSYSGVQGNTNAYSLAIGTDVPASKVTGCGWMMGYITNFLYSPLTITQGTYFALVGGGIDVHYPLCLTPTEAYGIDTKIDDGLPSSGNDIDGNFDFFSVLLGYSYSNVFLSNATVGVIRLRNPCTQSPYTQYNTSASGIDCTPFFYTGL
jgi:prepilin-type N-terminal cleavage/methylation domain-containing protein